MLGSSLTATQLPEPDEVVGSWSASRVFDSLLRREATPTNIVQAAQGKLVLGQPRRAIEILEKYSLADSVQNGASIRLYATALYDVGEFSRAASGFTRAAAYAQGVRKGVLLARSAEAYERAGLPTVAARRYAEAITALPELAGWLRVRLAITDSDPANGPRHLASVHPAASRLADVIRADLKVKSGDSTGGLNALLALKEFGRATELGLAMGDSVAVRGIVYQALVSGSNDERLQAAKRAVELFPPLSVGEHRVVALAFSRHAMWREARAELRQMVALGDRSVETLTRYADATAASGDRAAALELYLEASDGRTVAHGEAQFRRARLLVNMRRSDAWGALERFVVAFPNHEQTPLALFLMADLDQDRGRHARADSLFATVALVWPRDARASQARIRMATRALGSGDTMTAVKLFESEISSGGAEARSAQFLLGRIAFLSGQEAKARAVWTQLAVDDSVGYYGTIARQAADLPAPYFPTPTATEPDSAVRATLAQLDLLNAIRMQTESNALVDWLTDTSVWNTEQLIQIGEGLNQRGRTSEGIALGWTLTRTLSLNHPRVVRIIFPWPHRQLIESKSLEAGLDPFLVAGLIRQESAFRATVVSHAGAHGLMQLMPSTAQWVAGRLDMEWDNSLLVVPDANVHVGTTHLAALLRQYENQLIPSLAAYNAGGRPVSRWLRMPEAQDPYLFVERIPYRETRGYVRTLLRNYALYRALYGVEATAIP